LDPYTNATLEQVVLSSTLPRDKFFGSRHESDEAKVLSLYATPPTAMPDKFLAWAVRAMRVYASSLYRLNPSRATSPTQISNVPSQDTADTLYPADNIAHQGESDGPSSEVILGLISDHSISPSLSETPEISPASSSRAAVDGNVILDSEEATPEIDLELTSARGVAPIDYNSDATQPDSRRHPAEWTIRLSVTQTVTAVMALLLTFSLLGPQILDHDMNELNIKLSQ
jgi:hypothetical protein